MSSTATVLSTFPQNSFRFLANSTNESRFSPLPRPHQSDRSAAHKTGFAAISNMSSAAYYGQRVAPHETMASGRDPYNVAQMDRWSVTRETPNWQDGYHAYPIQNSSQQRQQYQPPHVPLQSKQASSNTVSRQTTRPSTPNSTHSSQAASVTTLGADAQSMVLHSMQIPKCISPKAGNLADFAAQVR